MKKPNLKSTAFLKGQMLDRAEMKNVSGGKSASFICQRSICEGVDSNGNSFEGICSPACFCVSGASSSKGCDL
jgi:hypothetical protein